MTPTLFDERLVVLDDDAMTEVVGGGDGRRYGKHRRHHRPRFHRRHRHHRRHRRYGGRH